MLRAAVEPQFEIIAEALNQMLKRDASLAIHISNHQRIMAFRNRLIHGYADIDYEVVGGVLAANLPTLRHEVKVLLSEDEQT